MAEGNYWQRLATARRGRRSVLRGGVIASAGLAVTGLVGCSSSNNNTGSRPANTTAGTAAGNGTPRSGGSPAANATGEQPKPGGTISQRIPSDPQALDIHQVSTYGAVWPEAPSYNQLLQIDPQDATDSKIIPDLADTFETLDNGMTYVFHLHPGVKFHDGMPFTSADVKASLDWIKTPTNKKPSPRSGVLGAVSGIETPDAATVTLKLTRPNPSLLLNLASHYFAIGPKAVIDSSGDLGDKLIGTGPFKFKNYQRGERVDLEKNPSYWVSGRPYLDALSYYVVPDDNTGFTNFLGGQYQQWHDVKPENVDRIKSETSAKAENVSVGSFTRNVIFFNTKKKPWDDIRVRQAVSLALDRKDSIDTVQGGFGELGSYMVSSGAWGLPADQIKAVPGYTSDKGNIDQAKALLAQAGVSLPLKGSLLSRNDFQGIYTWTQQALTKIGINLDLDPKDTAAAYDSAYKGQFDVIAWTVSIALDDPDATFAEISTSKAVRNWSQLNDPEIDDLYDKQSQELDNAKRKQLVNQMDKKAMSIFQTLQLYYIKYNEGNYLSVRNYKFHPSLYTNKRLQDVWLNR